MDHGWWVLLWIALGFALLLTWRAIANWRDRKYESSPGDRSTASDVWKIEHYEAPPIIHPPPPDVVEGLRKADWMKIRNSGERGPATPWSSYDDDYMDKDDDDTA